MGIPNAVNPLILIILIELTQLKAIPSPQGEG